MGGAAPYIALQMRRGDKSKSLDVVGLTVAKVLEKTAKLAASLRLRVIVATDDHSPETREAIKRRGFFVVDEAAIRRSAIAADATDSLGQEPGPQLGD